MIPAIGRTGHDKLTALVSARPDRRSRRALHAALNGNSGTRQGHAREDGRPAPGPRRRRGHAPVSPACAPATTAIQRVATEPGRAGTARDLHWAAAALLTEAEPHQLTVAPAAPVAAPGK